MSIRESIEKNKVWVVVVMLGVLLLSAWIILGQWSNSRSPVKQVYFSVDDGATWFLDSVDKLAPFEHGGKQAVRAHIYSDKGKEFCAFLEQITPEAKAVAEKLAPDLEAAKKAASLPEDQGRPEDAFARLEPLMRKYDSNLSKGRQYKKPGATQWVPANSPEGMSLMDVRTSDGKLAEMVVGR